MIQQINMLAFLAKYQFPDETYIPNVPNYMKWAANIVIFDRNKTRNIFLSVEDKHCSKWHISWNKPSGWKLNLRSEKKNFIFKLTKLGEWNLFSLKQGIISVFNSRWSTFSKILGSYDTDLILVPKRLITVNCRLCAIEIAESEFKFSQKSWAWI